jgi:hypothetical protein
MAEISVQICLSATREELKFRFLCSGVSFRHDSQGGLNDVGCFLFNCSMLGRGKEGESPG